MKSKKMKRLSILTFVLSLLITGGIFAYWASSVLGNEKDAATAIQIGQGNEATTTVSLNEVSKTQGKLVPAGFATSALETEEIIIKFEVTLLADQANADGAEATLVVSVTDTGHALINVVVLEHENTIIAGGAKVEVNLKVTLTEPANKAEYDEVANKDFEIKVKFEAVI